MEIYEQMKNAGIETASWQSDLYVPVNKTTQRILKKYKYKNQVTTFREQGTNRLMFDIPFAYAPYWEKRNG